MKKHMCMTIDKQPTHPDVQYTGSKTIASQRASLLYHRPDRPSARQPQVPKRWSISLLKPAYDSSRTHCCNYLTKTSSSILSLRHGICQLFRYQRTAAPPRCELSKLPLPLSAFRKQDWNESRIHPDLTLPSLLIKGRTSSPCMLAGLRH